MSVAIFILYGHNIPLLRFGRMSPCIRHVVAQVGVKMGWRATITDKAGLTALTDPAK
jgi:hypothetical protein